jgi:predicted nucleic acid-binding protein
MTSTIVIDASALVKRVLAEPDSARFRAWFNENDSARFTAPSLIFYETGRVLEKSLAGAEASELRALHSRLLAGVVLIPPSEAAWDARRDLTFYDAQYIEVAKRLDAVLLTADERMRTAASERGVDAPRM